MFSKHCLVVKKVLKFKSEASDSKVLVNWQSQIEPDDIKTRTH